MAKPKPDGGAAFPRVCSTPSDFVWPGMSLRDYFAGQALAGMLADHNVQAAPRSIATDAYIFADMMIAERDS